MVDYYGLPQTEGRAWPGRVEASALPFAQKASTVENAMMAEIVAEMGGDDFYPNRSFRLSSCTNLKHCSSVIVLVLAAL